MMAQTYPWKAIARSVIGSGHQEQQIPCQDYSQYQLLDSGNIIIGAVADGAGSAFLSHVGAEIAVKSALAYLQQWHDFRQRHASFSPSELSEPQLTHFFSKLIQRIQRTLERQSQLLDCPLSALATTLLVFAANQEGAIAMQIGDGFLLVRPQGEDYQLLFRPDKGEFINETTFVTSATALDFLQVSICPKPLEFICAATDGLEKVAIKYSDWSPFPPFFKPLETFLQETPDPEAEANYLEQFLNSERLNHRTQDDKTLLLCLSVIE
jgi:serine/threonine protein phosphatase PrpC